MRKGRLLRNVAVAVGLLSIGFAAFARVPYPVDSTYEDTVRVCVLWNVQQGVCGNMPNVGEQTRDFVIRALDTNVIHNVKVLETAHFNNLTWPDGNGNTPSSWTTTTAISNLWPGKLPHVLVHLNSGWGIYNGPYLANVFTWAVNHWIGVVEIGDDAAWMATSTFGFNYVSNLPAPMYTAMWLNKPEDSLWIKLQADKDTLVDSTQYPYLTGIVRNTVKKVLNGDSTVYFWPIDSTRADSVRCEADPDGFTRVVDSLVTLLGYQQGWNATYEPGPAFAPVEGDSNAPVGIVGAPESLSVVAAFHQSGTYGGEPVFRRAVSISLQPQFLQNETAMQQLIYDAVMYSSLVKSAYFEDPIDTIPDTNRVVQQIVSSPAGSMTIGAAGQRLTLKMWVPGSLRSLRVELFDVNGKMLGTKSIMQPKAGRLEMPVAARTSAGSMCLVRVRTETLAGVQKNNVTRVVIR